MCLSLLARFSIGSLLVLPTALTVSESLSAQADAPAATTPSTTTPSATTPGGAMVEPFVGLKRGESLDWIAPFAGSSNSAAAGFEFRHGRVLKDATGFPVFGATIELWTEEIDPKNGGFVRIGAATSGRDGRFAIRKRLGATVNSGKVRGSAPGFVTLSASYSDLFGPLLLRAIDPEEPMPSIRIVDTSSRPIAGVRITSTKTCAHDLPAFEVETGADGIAWLPAYGDAQDPQELRLRAPGYHAVKYVDLSAELAGGDRGEEAHLGTITLLRCEPVRFRVVDQQGRPRVHQAIHYQDNPGFQVDRTDENGVVTFAQRYGSDIGEALLLTTDEATFLGGVLPVGQSSDFVPTMRLQSDDLLAGAPRGEVLLVWKSQEAGDPAPPKAIPVSLFHAKGWSRAGWSLDPDEAITCPAGEVHVVVGGPFSGFDRQVFKLEVPADGRVLKALEPRSEPRIRIEVAGFDADQSERLDHRLWIESALGVTKFDVSLSTAVSVPDAPLVVGLGEGLKSRVLMSMPGVFDGQTLVLDPKACGLEEADDEDSADGSGLDADTVVRRVRFVSLPGREPILDPKEDLPLLDGEGGWREIRAAAGSRVELDPRFRGHLHTLPRVRLSADDRESWEIAVPRYARLDLPGRADRFEVVGDDGLEFTKLSPGPLQLVLRFRDGRQKGLSIVLEPGEHRRIDV